jgi:hypothetical protein
MVEASVAAAQSSFGIERFAADWEKGHALPGDQALASAISIADALREESGAPAAGNSSS